MTTVGRQEIASMGRSYRIGEVAKLLGEPTHVIRYWESVFGIYTTRNRGGQRVYAEREVARLTVIRHLLRTDLFTIEGAKRQLKAMEDTARSAVA